MSTVETPLAELFQTHRSGLAGAVRSVLGPTADVTEVLQDAFLKCWRAWRRGTRPNDPVAWMFVITWNTATDARRARQRRPHHEQLDEERTVSATTPASPSGALEQRETLAEAQSAIAKLRDDDQQVFLLRVAGELSYEGIAEALAIPTGTAKTRMRRALHQLRTALGAPATKEDLQ
jgi:RNA polymerase sigma factor (sigma-70 family)